MRQLRHVVRLRHKLARNGPSVIVEHLAVHVAVLLYQLAVLSLLIWVL